MFTKKFEEETNLRCQIIIDTSSSMYFPEQRKSNQLNKLQFSALAAACVMNLLKKQRDAFGLSIFDSDVRIHTKCRSATSHYRLLLTYLDELIRDNKHQKTTSTSKALHQLADNINRRSLVIIFSDMFDNTDNNDDMFAALQHLKYAKHEVILFHVTDKKHELDFEFENRPYLFVDMETGEEIKLQHNQVKELYTNKIQTFQDQLKLKCLQYKIDFVEADINQGFDIILQNYLVKRIKLK